MNGEQFLTELAGQVVAGLRGNDGIKRLVKNSAVIGAYAEATVRSVVARMVSPLRVSTGAVISEQLCSNPKSVP
jgi:hypothetical protein